MSIFSRLFGKKTQQTKQPRKQKIKSNLTIVNVNGVEFTKAEQKEFYSLAKQANKTRKHMLKHEGNLLAILGGEQTNMRVKDTHWKMGKESDFALREKNTNINVFRDKAEFNRYINYLQYVNQPDYIGRKMNRYRDNFILSIQKVYGTGEKATKLINTLKELEIMDFADLVAAGDIFEISYLDSGDTPAMQADGFADKTLQKMSDILGIE
jgi:hypothetical protein